MTLVSYKYTAKNGQTQKTKSYPEACEWVKNYGGSFKIEYEYVETGCVAYCMKGAAYATDRWKNYKF